MLQSPSSLPARTAQIDQKPRARPPYRHASILFATGGFRTVIEHAVTCVFGVQHEDLHLPRRGRAGIALARQAAMYLAHTSFSLTYAEVGTLFERDRTTVSHACRAIEDRREDPLFDRALELLDRAIRALLYPRFFDLLKRLPVSKNMTPKALRSPGPKPPSICSPLSLLVKLAKRECVGELVVAANGTRALKLITGSGIADRPGAVAPYAVFAEARDQGWIAPRDEAGLRWGVSQSGRLLLRRIQSQGEGIVRTALTAQLPAVPSKPSVDPAESPLSWLRRRKDKSGQPLITALEFDAGERLRADLWFAQMSPRVTVNWSANGGAPKGGGGIGIEVRDNVAAAQQRVRRALAAVGTISAGVLIDVCGHLHGLEQIERSRGWPSRSGKVALQMALLELARHYGLPGVEAAAAPHAARLQHWGVIDFRPTAGNEPEG